MDIRKVKKLIELLDESGIAEIEITEGDDAVRISRYAPQVAAPVAAAMPAVAAAPAAAAAPVPAPSSPLAMAEAEEDGHVVTAPMVGTSITPRRRVPRLSSRSAIGWKSVTRCASSKP